MPGGDDDDDAASLGFSDITFEVDGRRMHAHRCILTARCPPLEQLVAASITAHHGGDGEGNGDNNSGESSDNNSGESSDASTLSEGKDEELTDVQAAIDVVVRIDKIHASVFAALLLYLYTDRLEVPEHRIGHLSSLANRFNLSHLKHLCDLRRGIAGGPRRMRKREDRGEAVVQAGDRGALLDQIQAGSAVLRKASGTQHPRPASRFKMGGLKRADPTATAPPNAVATDSELPTLSGDGGGESKQQQADIDSGDASSSRITVGIDLTARDASSSAAVAVNTAHHKNAMAGALQSLQKPTKKLLDLRRECKQNGLEHTGSRSELEARLEGRESAATPKQDVASSTVALSDTVPVAGAAAGTAGGVDVAVAGMSGAAVVTSTTDAPNSVRAVGTASSVATGQIGQETKEEHPSSSSSSSGDKDVRSSQSGSTFTRDMSLLVASALHSDIQFRVPIGAKGEGEDQKDGDVDDGRDGRGGNSAVDIGDGAAVGVSGGGSAVLSAHKALLYRYPFFNGLLTGPFAEMDKTEISIGGEDACEPVFRLVLAWMYTGDRVLVDDETVVSLLAAACRFGIEDLQLVCETFIAERLDVDNAGDCLQIADMFSLKRLARQCHELLADEGV